jgi:uncharacterized damage-inducible protein DinB
MLKATLIEFFERELLKLKEEISLYPNEPDLWTLQGTVSNSAGNLCLHLIGNLNHFIGSVLGNTGYVRQRELEFSLKNIPRAEMLTDIDRTIDMVVKTLNALTEADFYASYPIDKHGKTVSTDYMLMHLLTHLNYHLGQINYHRRLMS